MKIVLIGYGAMGQLVGKVAEERGHEIVQAIDLAEIGLSIDELSNRLCGSDVAIDFSIADVVPKNVTACARAGVPLVLGTTGWLSQLSEVRQIVTRHNGALIFGANFSVGVQLFYRIATRAAELFGTVKSYDGFIEEAHHKRKRDTPSGTALELKQIVTEGLGREILVTSTRAGYIPGTHRLGFDSSADQITLTHTARSREGFAAGALLAAEWIVERKGVYEFSEVFDEILATETQRRRE